MSKWCPLSTHQHGDLNSSNILVDVHDGLWLIGGLLLEPDCTCQLREIKTYAFDVPKRTSWQTANRQEWCVMVQDKLRNAIELHLPTHKNLFLDYLDDALATR